MSSNPVFEQKLAATWPTDRWAEVGVLVAVSGGPDSVALVHALRRLNPQASLTVAHFNHGWRPEAGLADQRFVEGLCDSLGTACQVGKGESPPGESPGSREAAAREARYAFLLEVAHRVGARYVVTGHTADDQAETILHHILRGTGLAGLAGMRRVRVLSPAVSLVRPLLGLGRAEVLEYLHAIGQDFRQDETNADTSLTRNRIRRELLPLLERDYAPGVVEALLRLGNVAGDAQRLIESQAEALLDRALVVRDPRRVEIDCRALDGTDRHLVREMFVAVWRGQNWPRQAMGLHEWNQLAELALTEEANPTPLQQLPLAISARRQEARLVLSGPARNCGPFHA
ncbi:MAG: tRNA lysidine(34) synthetase TilS [Planctomycetota bacterium]|nr:MAG: tRNA lysidine(34) synthetase TilS [Planctomycetota bacterium]